MSSRTAGLLVAGALATAALAGCSDDAGTPGTPSQRIVYRVEDRTHGLRVTTVVADSVAPYLGRSVTLEGPPPGGVSLGGAAWDADTQFLLKATGEAAVVQEVAAGTAGVYPSLAVALASAERHGLARRTETATVAGIACQGWLTQSPLDSDPLTAATATDRTVSCVDADGRLLQDTWTLGGKVVRVRTAVQLGAGPTLEGAGLLQGRSPQPADPQQAREQVRVEPVQRLADAFAIPVPLAPKGFELDRATAFVTLNDAGEHRTEGVVFTYRAGTQLAVLRLEQGLGFRLPQGTGGVAVRLPGRAGARLTPQVNGLRLDFSPRTGRNARIVSSLTEDALLAWAATLELGG